MVSPAPDSPSSPTPKRIPTVVFPDGFNPYGAGGSRKSDQPVTAKLGCPKCGQDHVRAGLRTCHAHKARTDPPQPCKNHPPQGLGVCRFHGGKAPQTIQAGQRRTVRDMLEETILISVLEHAAAHPLPPLLPAPKPKKGGHKNPNSRSARRARLRRETGRRDEVLPSRRDDPDGLAGRLEP